MANAGTQTYVWARRQSKDVARNMSAKHVKQLIIAAVGILAAALWAGQTTPLAAQTLTLPYPWCALGESLHCDFSTLQQCEETVDYHGFCERNPDMPAQQTPQNNNARRRTYPQ
jgi:hypothetical protein